jgi:Ice-binding-like
MCNTALSTIGQVEQTITFAAPVAQATCGSTFAIAPTVGSGLRVTVTPSGGCSMAGITVTMTGGTVHCVLAGGALARNVFWWVGSSATLDTGANGSQGKGNILALTTINIGGSVALTGTALAQRGAVNLGAGNNITLP